MSSAASRLGQQAAARNDPTGWFEALYTQAETGDAEVPWDRAEPNQLIASWLDAHPIDPAGRRAVVIGCGFGKDAEHLASLGFDTTAFDIAPTAVRTCVDRHPDTAVRYVVADLLDLPADWLGAFDLVVESITVQSMPPFARERAIAGVRDLLAPGGDLLVVSVGRPDGVEVDGPPWPLDTAELDAFAADGLRVVELERLPHAESPLHLWRVHLTR